MIYVTLENKMAQIFTDLKEAYLSATFADYSSRGTREIRNNLAPRTRLLVAELIKLKHRVDKDARGFDEKAEQTKTFNSVYLGVG